MLASKGHYWVNMSGAILLAGLELSKSEGVLMMLHTAIIGALAFSAFTAADMLDVVELQRWPAHFGGAGRGMGRVVLTDKDDEWNVLKRQPVGHVVAKEITDAEKRRD